MNKEELTALVADILRGMDTPSAPCSVKKEEGERVAADVSNMDLRKLYMVKDAADGERFRKMKLHTPARLGCGKAGARYKTLTMLRFRADHAAAQDAVFSQVAEDFAEENGMVAVRTKCEDKDQYLTRPDLGRTFDEENQNKIRLAVPNRPKVQIVIGDGLSSKIMICKQRPQKHFGVRRFACSANRHITDADCRHICLMHLFYTLVVEIMSDL